MWGDRKEGQKNGKEMRGEREGEKDACREIKRGRDGEGPTEKVGQIRWETEGTWGHGGRVAAGRGDPKEADEVAGGPSGGGDRERCSGHWVVGGRLGDCGDRTGLEGMGHLPSLVWHPRGEVGFVGNRAAVLDLWAEWRLRGTLC